jgi:YVTN family beta-propeller protein
LKPRIMLFLLLGFFLWGCQASLKQLNPPLENEGEVYLYLQPFPYETEGLRFTVETLGAIDAEGREFPLSVLLQEVKGEGMRRQRLLASGALPAGRYLGFSLKVRQAFLRREGGEAALLVPEKPTRLDFPFTVARKKGYVFLLVFKYPESTPGELSFSPVFSIFFPDRPLADLTGFVTNSDGNNIMVFNKKSFQVVGVIPTGRKPSGMALDQQFRRAYVAIRGDDTIDFIDVLGGQVFDRLRLNSGDEPCELALTPDGRMLLSANTGSNTVSFIDPRSRFEVGRVRVGNGPRSISIDPTGRRAFVFNTLGNTISVIDIPNRALVTSISTDSGPVRGAFNRRGDKLYIIHELSPYVAVLNPASLSFSGRFPVRISGMSSIKVSSPTDLIYLGGSRDFFVGLFDPLSFAPVDRIPTGIGVSYMTIDGEGNNLYMVSTASGRVLISNLINRRIIGEMDVGEGPYWVTMMGER